LKEPFVILKTNCIESEQETAVIDKIIDGLLDCTFMVVIVALTVVVMFAIGG
jgi:hypothetical protein